MLYLMLEADQPLGSNEATACYMVDRGHAQNQF